MNTDQKMRAALEECLKDREEGVGLDLAQCVATKVGTNAAAFREWMKQNNIDPATGA